MDVRLDGKCALITGGSRGIGFAIAKKFAESGADVAILSRSREKLDQAKAEIAKSAQTRIVAIECDVAERASVERAFSQAVDALGKIDILVNNAGSSQRGKFLEVTDERWQSDIDLKVFGAIRLARLAIPGMQKRKWGRIINICSAHSLRASPFKCAYVSAKHGLAGFTKTVALELAEHGVTSNAISPGFVWTPLVEKQIPDLAKSENITLEQAKKHVLSRQPTNQFVTVEQVAALAAFLASEAAASITGANYSIDGGWTAQ